MGVLARILYKIGEVLTDSVFSTVSALCIYCGSTNVGLRMRLELIMFLPFLALYDIYEYVKCCTMYNGV